MKNFFVVLLTHSLFFAIGQKNVYSDSESLITGTWNANGVLSEVGTDGPHEGSKHYQFSYDFTEYWSGVGLNMDNWGNDPGKDLSGYTHLSIAYRGLASGDLLTISLRDANSSSNTITIGGSAITYTIVELPMIGITAGTSIDLTSITEINISATSDNTTSTGQVFFDDIKLINKQINSGTSQQTWSRFAKLSKGFNYANWLEAHWLFPFNAYPEVNRFTRNIVEQLVNLGFDSARLPVTFERLAGQSSPYTLDTQSEAFALIDSAITWANDYDISLIITNHHGFELTDANYISELPRIRSVWNQVREHLGYLDPERFFFELYNEPTNTISNENFQIVADSLIKDFRNNGLTHSLIVGGNGYNSVNGLLSTVPYNDPDIIYTFHSYDPYFFTHQQMSWTTPANLPARTFPANATEVTELESLIEAAHTYSQTFNVPVFMGEFGASTGADAQSRCNYVEIIGNTTFAYNMPYYYWDATSLTDAFGFIDNGNAVDCFAEALRLENFNVCDLMVISKENNGPGSLRSALQCAEDDDIIDINVSLASDTIDLTLPSLFIHKDITIRQLGPNPTVINALSNTGVLEVAKEHSLTLENVEFIETLESSSPVVNVKGQLILKNVNLKKE